MTLVGHPRAEEARTKIHVAADTRRSEQRSRCQRVLIIVENLPVPFDRRVWSEATALNAGGYDVSIICPRGRGPAKSFEVIDGIRIHRHWLPLEARGPLGYLLEYCVALFWEFILSFKIYISEGFDVIHACNPPDLIFLIAVFFKYLFGVRFVFDHHDINPELYEAKFGRRDFFWRMMLFLERCTFSVADLSIATNESYKAIAIERGGMDRERVFIVRSGPNLTRLRYPPANPSWKKGKDFLVAYVGVIGDQEGLDLLLEAALKVQLRRRKNDVQYVIVGNGPAVEKIKLLTSEMGLEEMVTFPGRVHDEQLFEILSTADVCVNPDRPNEMNDKSTMNKVMEYMAFSKPIVQFDLREGRFSAEKASLYAKNTDTDDFAAKICLLLDNGELRRDMGEFGRKRVQEKLSWVHEAPKLLTAYESLITKSRRGEKKPQFSGFSSVER